MRKAIARIVLSSIFVVSIIVFVASKQLVFANTVFPNVSDVYDYVDGEFDDYIDSDFLLNSTSYQITDYKSEYWTNEVSHNSETNNLTVYGDDYITEVIPRILFIHRGTYFIIGQEYAIFVKNVAYTTYGNSVTVLIIDIERSYDITNPSTPSQISHKIKPIFEGTFYYLTSQDNFNTDEFNVVNESNQDSIIIPKPTIYYDAETDYYLATFSETTDYFIKDITFNSVMQNIQHVNQGEANYIPENDMGSFFTRSQIYYDGVSGQHIWPTILATIEFGIGQVPILGNVLGFLTYSYGLLTDVVADFRETESYVQKNVESTYGSAYEQVLHNSYLNKAMHTKVSSTNSEPLLFGRTNNDNYVEIQYYLGQTENWYTKFDSSITMSIVENDVWGTTEQAVSTEQYTQNIRDIEYKELPEEINVQGYSMPYISDYFEFVPEHTGSYLLSASSSNYSVSIYNENKTLIKSGVSSITQNVEKGRTYYIYVTSRIGNNSHFLIKASLNTISPSASFSYGVSPYGTYSVKVYSATTVIKNILSTNSNVKITIFEYIDGERVYYEESNYSNATMQFHQGRTFYLELTNQTSQFQSGTLVMSNPIMMTLANDVSKVVNGDLIYGFTAPSSNYYTIALLSNDTVNFGLYNQGSMTPVAASVTSGEGYTLYKLYMSQGSTIYFGYTNSYNILMKLSIKQSSSLFTWYQNSSVINGDKIYLKQGQSANIAAKIGSFQINSGNFIWEDTYSARLSNGLLSILPNAYPTSSGDQAHEITIVHDSNVSILYIYILANVSITITGKQDSNVGAGVYWNATLMSPNDQVELLFKYTFTSGMTVFSDLIIGRNGYTYIDDAFTQSYGEMYATISLHSVTYKQYRNSGQYYASIPMINTSNQSALPHEDSLSVPSIQINTMFFDGTGSSSSPFQIKNERHLNNIRYTATEYREEDNILYYIQKHFVIMNDINLINPWVPIDAPMMSGSIKGYLNNVKNINNFIIVENKASKDIGFIRNMYGGEISKITINGQIVINNTTNATIIGVGMFAGGLSSGTLSYVSSKGSITVNAKNTYTGGLTGFAFSSSHISYSDNSATITGYGYVGGITGYIFLSVLDAVTNTGLVVLKHDNVFLSSEDKNVGAGGIAGLMYGGGTVKNSSSSSIVRYTSSAKNKDKKLDPKMGILIGWKQSGTLTNNTATGMIDSGNLNQWTEGVLWWATTYSQKEYLGGSIGKTGD